MKLHEGDIVITKQEHEDLSALVICAVRYCYGRQTYMPGLIIDFLMSKPDLLDSRTMNVILNDFGDGADEFMYGDPKIDKPQWERFLAFIKTRLEGMDEK